MQYNLPAWPAHIKKNDSFVYIGNGRKGGIPGLYDTKSIVVGADVTDLDGFIKSNRLGSNLHGHYFVKKDDPLLKQFEIKPKNKMPAHLPPLSEGYVYLGRLDEINVPQEWHKNRGWEKKLGDFAWFWTKYGMPKWREVGVEGGWINPKDAVYVAAKPNSELYLLNKKAPKETLKSLKAEIEKLKEENKLIVCENEKLKAKIEFVKKGLL